MVREYYFRAAKAAWAELISNWRRELIYGLLGAGLYLAVAIPIRGKVDWLTLVPLAVPLLIFGWHFVRGPALVAQAQRAEVADLRHSLEHMGQVNAQLQQELADVRAEHEQEARFRAQLREGAHEFLFKQLPRIQNEPGNEQQHRDGALNSCGARAGWSPTRCASAASRGKRTGWKRSWSKQPQRVRWTR